MDVKPDCLRKQQNYLVRNISNTATALCHCKGVPLYRRSAVPLQRHGLCCLVVTSCFQLGDCRMTASFQDVVNAFDQKVVDLRALVKGNLA